MLQSSIYLLIEVNMESKISLTFDILYTWENKGKNILKNGTIQIGKVPHIAPQAWFHEIYNKLSDEQIDTIEEELHAKIPLDFRKFYKICNGINIFSDSLSISGLKLSEERIGEEAIQPYSIFITNYGRPEGCPNTWIFFGRYRWDGSKVFFDLKNGLDSSRVYYIERDSLKIKKEWPDFFSFILDETQRLSKMYDENGKKLDLNASTIPV
jgi:SMI1 / KNR4 family.